MKHKMPATEKIRAHAIPLWAGFMVWFIVESERVIMYTNRHTEQDNFMYVTATYQLLLSSLTSFSRPNHLFAWISLVFQTYKCFFLA
jgi:hypothetical protein